MGEDKGLITYQGISLVQTQYKKLQSICDRVVASINPEQVDAYGKVVISDSLIVDSVSIPGPLKGLLSVHQAFPNKDLLVLACDVPLITEELLTKLIETSSFAPSHEFYVYCNADEYEPLVGIYKSNGLSRIKSLFDDGKLERYSMKNALATGDTHTLDIEEADKAYFKNFNFKGDLYTDLSDSSPENKVD